MEESEGCDYQNKMWVGLILAMWQVALLKIGSSEAEGGSLQELCKCA